MASFELRALWDEIGLRNLGLRCGPRILECRPDRWLGVPSARLVLTGVGLSALLATMTRSSDSRSSTLKPHAKQTPTMKFLTKTALVAVAAVFAVSAPAQTPDVNAPIQVQRYAAPIRVACVGDSITAGSGTKVRELESYPAQLQRMLDEHAWLVGNFGVSGATLMNSGDKPYQKLPALQDALKFNPDVVIVMLGTNDSKPQNWRFKEQFVADYHDLLGRFKALPKAPRLFICRPVVVIGAGAFGINGDAVTEELPLIDAIAKKAQVGVIDMRGALGSREDLLPDHVHPNTAGANRLARAAYRALTGGEFTGTLATARP